MCGIVGLINCGDEKTIIRMTELLSHRGPDDRGIVWFKENNSGLGHRRLSIIDLTPAGHQPMASDDKQLWITYNGEIYNFLEIKNELLSKGYLLKSNTDTEVIIYAFKEWGYDCLKKFNGMFAFAIWDNERKELFAARDRIGIKPFYYYHNEQNNSLILASEIKSLLSSGLVKKEIDYDAIITPTRFQISPNTGFKDIKKLKPGHYLISKNGQLVIKEYWDIEPDEVNISNSDAFERLDFLLNDAVKLQMISDVKVGLFLSGGLDSSIIGSLMRKNSNLDIYSFTIKFSEKDNKFEKSVNDSHYAKKVANKFNFIYHELELNPNIIDLLPKIIYQLDEPLTDPAAINTFLLSEMARDEGIFVMLNGMGGDEIFGGYRKYLACLGAAVYQKITPQFVSKKIETYFENIKVANNTKGFRNLRWTKRFFSFSSLPPFERFLYSDLALKSDDFRDLFLSKPDYFDTYFYKVQKSLFEKYKISYLTKMCLIDTKFFLQEHNLLYSDKASMLAGIESRPPLTDHRIVEFMFSLPQKFRIKFNTQKYLLKKVSEKYLNKEIIYRPKAPFGAPLRSWIRRDLKSMIDDLLSENEIKKTNIYDYKAVKKIIEDDRNGLQDNSFFIYQILSTQLWLKTFFEN